MDVTISSPTHLITCAGPNCGAVVPFTESMYVDGAGQLCTANCTAALPESARDIEPPF